MQVHKVTQEEYELFVGKGAIDIIPEELFKEKLTEGERMRLYLGVDPTGPDIHVGHAVILRAMRQLQDWGHEVILLIGDFTARIGDPTGKDKMRVTLSSEEVMENAKTYKEQAAKILDFEGENAVQLKFNSEWLEKLSFADVIELTANFTVQQMMERDMFEKREKEGKPIYVHEFMYPVMQGYDSVAMDVDLECGGTDQLFNMLAGRTLQKSLNDREKMVIGFELLEGLDGRKMSKSYNNIVGVMDEPADMYGKIMSLDDQLISKYYRLVVGAPAQKLEEIRDRAAAGEHPRDLKMELAREVVALYHSQEAAEAAQEEFVRVFQEKSRPTDIEEVTLSADELNIVDCVVESGFAQSKGEARRLVQQGGVRLNDKKVEDIDALAKRGEVLQVGKRKFAQLV